MDGYHPYFGLSRPGLAGNRERRNRKRMPQHGAYVTGNDRLVTAIRQRRPRRVCAGESRSSSIKLFDVPTAGHHPMHLIKVYLNETMPYI
jgi:hypothetical protein